MNNRNSRYKLIAIVSVYVIIFISAFPFSVNYQNQILAQKGTKFQHPFPILYDHGLKIELVADGLSVPTGMLFLDKNNMLVTQRYTSGFPLGGLTVVRLITNGSLNSEPVLTVPSGLCDIKNIKTCDLFNERGLLGITARKIDLDNASIAGNLHVYLYYTEVTLNGEVLGNRVYKYLWDGKRLVNPALVMDLPALPNQSNNGGKILIGPDDYLYVIIGDITIANRTIPIHEDSKGIREVLCCNAGHRGQLQNIINGASPDNTSVILRINPESGLPAFHNPFGVADGANDKTGNTIENNSSTGNYSALNKIINYNSSQLGSYFAYGIRNSFGLTFDPITENLWDTENGEGNYDELNLVEPGFNSGWSKIMGPIDRINATSRDIQAYGNESWKQLNLKVLANVTQNDLVNFPGSRYSDPEFSWKNPIGVTALEFLNSSKLGEKYKNNLFVGDYNFGNLYFFKMNKNRDGVEVNNKNTGLNDLVADTADERSRIVLGSGFDIITDIKTGPDGYLYILSYSEYSNQRPDNVSRIYRIVPNP